MIQQHGNAGDQLQPLLGQVFFFHKHLSSAVAGYNKFRLLNLRDGRIILLGVIPRSNHSANPLWI